MKFILLTVFISILFYGYPPYAKAVNVSLSVCEYIAADDKKRLRSFLKKNRLKIRKIFSGISCKGKNMLVFAAVSNSKNVGKLIIGKLSKEVIKENLPDITQHSELLAGIAKKRIQ
ncbi:MAG: DUF3718 domain-containing protein [Alteromonadaceae bacterium]|nr:DUF3718 domain-containing protein [Alteromonadaceae bacterium]